MQKKKQKFLHMMLLLCVFIFGMYLNEIQEDFLFPYILENTITPYSILMAENSDLTEPQVCTAEMSGLHIGKGTKVLQQFVKLRDTRVSLDFLCKANFSITTGKAAADVKSIQSDLAKQKKHITNYIHKSDGKKRN